MLGNNFSQLWPHILLNADRPSSWPKLELSSFFFLLSSSFVIALQNNFYVIKIRMKEFCVS